MFLSIVFDFFKLNSVNRFFILLFSSISIFLSIASVAFSSDLKSFFSFDNKEHPYIQFKINDGRVGIVASGFGGTYLRIASDIKSVVDSNKPNKRIRVVPMINRGSLEAILDVRHLKATEMGIMQADVMEEVKELATTGNETAQDLVERVKYITKLYDEEVHLIGRGVTRIGELDGRRVNVGAIGSGTKFTAEIILKRMEIKPSEQTTYSPALALEKLRNGEIDAMFFVVGKPAPLLLKIGEDKKRDSAIGLVDIAFDKDKIGAPYVSSIITDKDYPNLSDRYVETLAVPAILAVYHFTDQRRKNNVNRFSKAFVKNIKKLYQGAASEGKIYHKKWIEFVHRDYLNQEVSGWSRYEPMQEILDQTRPEKVSSNCSDAEVRVGIDTKKCSNYTQ
ncbi:MAG: TAXI family TRAP transporter solute-binding subunit [Pseudomonadota bacterium]